MISSRSTVRLAICLVVVSALGAATFGAVAVGRGAAAGGPGGAAPWEAALTDRGAALNAALAHARATGGAPTESKLVADLALARAATAKYVTNLALAKANGYGIITKMIPDMGYHYMDPSVKGFNVRKPPILVYEHQGKAWQLGAIEWVFTSKPKTPPLPGARYGAFGAGCHYKDGTFFPADSQNACPKTAPETSAAFSFWHPPLVTMHLWLWYPNPTGLFASTNPLVSEFNNG
jgi:hypothetical protein